jgi:hypothetical protein
MNYEQTKIYCSENILRNVMHLSKDYKLKNDKIQIIDQYLRD